MVYELRLMCGAEGLEDGWKFIDVIEGRFCKNILRIRRFSAKGGN
jgi:hypothetical protein